MCVGKLSKTHCFLLPICSMACSHHIYSPDYIYNINFSISRVLKAQRGSWDIHSPSLNLSLKWECVVHATPRPLYPRETAPVPFKGGWGGRQDQSRWVWWREYLFAHRGSSPEPSSRQRSCYTANDIPARLYLRFYLKSLVYDNLPHITEYK
jgi:hypothetical protein